MLRLLAFSPFPAFLKSLIPQSHFKKTELFAAKN